MPTGTRLWKISLPEALVLAGIASFGLQGTKAHGVQLKGELAAAPFNYHLGA